MSKDRPPCRDLPVEPRLPDTTGLKNQRRISASGNTSIPTSMFLRVMFTHILIGIVIHTLSVDTVVWLPTLRFDVSSGPLFCCNHIHFAKDTLVPGHR